jgi:hypothetical protein
MNLPQSIRRFGATAMVIALGLLVSACLISPGKFTSALDLRKDGRFSYSYTGEIYMLGLSKLAELGGKTGTAGTFEPSTCYKEGDSMDERECTKGELAKQRSDWDEGQKSRTERGKKDAEMMRAMLGGIDPTSPKAAEEFADRLRKQSGWKSVTYKGDGLFEVDFAIAGRIDHDFIFPTIERFPMANAFLTLNRRADGTIRMDAPGFGAGSNGGGMSNFAQLAAMGSAMGSDKKEDAMPKFPALDGTLVLTTDGAILANNTDEGPAPFTTGQLLEWKISPRTAAAPTALVRLGS